MMSKLVFLTMPVSVYPATIFCFRAPPDPPRSHARATRSRGAIGERTGPINAKLGERGASKKPSQGFFCPYSRVRSPFFSTYELQRLRLLFIGTACLTPGGRRGSQGHRAGEAWTGSNRWRDGRERGVACTRVACTSLKARHKPLGKIYIYHLEVHPPAISAGQPTHHVVAPPRVPSRAGICAWCAAVRSLV